MALRVGLRHARYQARSTGDWTGIDFQCVHFAYDSPSGEVGEVLNSPIESRYQYVYTQGMRSLFLCLVCLFLTATVYAQSTTVTGTITDAGSQVWFNGTYSFSFKVAPSSPTAQYFWNGAPFSSSQTIAGNLNGSGHFSVSVPSNASITPSGSTWILTVCPAATATNGCYSLPFAFATGSQDISSAVIPPAVQVSMANPPAGAAAYADSEISQPRTGSTYFNLTDSTIHACSGFPACSPWLSISGAGGSLLPSNNTWTGTNAFTNAVTFSGGGVFGGTWSGSPTLTGTWNFSAPISGSITGNAATATNATNATNATTAVTATTATTAINLAGPGTVSGGYTHSGTEHFNGTTTAANLDGVFYIDGVTYPKTTAGLQSAIAAAIAVGGGIVDARGAGNISITSEIDVGNHAQVPVTLILPQAATWTVVGITNGTSCAIKQFSQSSIIGPGTGGSSAMVIHGGLASNNLDSLYCTETSPIGSGSYIRAEGFQIYNPNGATMANGAMNVQATFDGSDFTNITVASYGTVGLYLHGLACCGTNFTTFTSNGNNASGSLPVKIVLSAAALSVSFYNLSAVHAGAGLNEISITNSNWASERFYHTYSEGNLDNVTPNIAVTAPNANVEFYGTICNNSPTSTAYCLDIANSGTPTITAYGMQNVVGGSNNCINDHYSGKTYACDSNTGMLPDYFQGGIMIPPVLVSQLPTAAAKNAGQWRTVSDSTTVSAEGQTCVGGSGNIASAFSNGIVWKCF
jgi:hypothetical protein